MTRSLLPLLLLLLPVSAAFAQTLTGMTLALVSVGGGVPSSTSIPGGIPTTGTVTLSSAAPTGGVSVSLTSNVAAVAVPASVLITAGAVSAGFPVTTTPVASTVTATLTGTLASGGSPVTVTLIVTPPVVDAVTLSPTSVVGGGSATGTVVLLSQAPTGGTPVALSSNNPSATVPASVTVPAGATSATFPISTSGVTASILAVFTASGGGWSRTAHLAVTPTAVLYSLSLSPSALAGGNVGTGTVTLNGAAPTGGATVTLTNSNPAATVPSSVAVVAGATSATFSFTTSAVTASTGGTVGASYGGVNKSAPLTVTPATLSGVSLSPTAVTGGTPSTGTVTLTGKAPTGGTTVTLSSSSTSATVPPSVTVPAGSPSTTFTVTTSPVSAAATATITATYGVAKTASLTINPPAVAGLSLSPTSVMGGSPATGTVTLTGKAPTGGTTVTLSSNSTSATVPASALVVAGASTATFTVNTASVASATTATIMASSGGAAKTANLTINPTVASLTLTLMAAVNGQSSLGWTSVSGASSYNLYRSTTNGSGYTKIVANTTALTYLDQGLTNGTSYYYCVTSVSSSGVESAYSNQVTSQPTAQAFGFLNVGNGSVLSGQVTLYVSMASQAYGGEANPVIFSVDGTVYDTGGDQQEASGNGGANTSFVLATDGLANGPHTLNVQDVNGNSASVNVTFSNVLSNVRVPNMFDTSGGDGLPSSAAITATLSSAQPWTVSIVTVDSASSTVQSFSGNSSNINVSWNGNNSQGVEVPDDAYEVDISYGNGTQPMTKIGGTQFVTKGGIEGTQPANPGIGKYILSKNKIGDCFVMLDEDVFPSGFADMIAYLKTIKADLAPSQGNVWNKFSFIYHSTIYDPNFTPADIQRIDNHFKSPLTVFYVDCHGGIGTSNNGGDPFFRIGGHSWRAGTFSSPVSSAMATLTQSANYGINNPPALVFVDCCDSAASTETYPFHPNLEFSNDFDIGDGSSGFIGWDGFCGVYGEKPAPRDDWAFWRLDLWSQFTNINQTYDTAYSNLQRDYNAHGHNWAGLDGYPDTVVVVNWPSGSSF